MPSKAAPPKARDNSRRKSNRVTAAKDEVEDIDNISDIDSDDSPPSTAVDIPLREQEFITGAIASSVSELRPFITAFGLDITVEAIRQAFETRFPNVQQHIAERPVVDEKVNKVNQKHTIKDSLYFLPGADIPDGTQKSKKKKEGKK